MSATERTGPTQDTALPESPTDGPNMGCAIAVMGAVLFWLCVASAFLFLAWKG